jgi:hypothetical protein
MHYFYKTIAAQLMVMFTDTHSMRTKIWVNIFASILLAYILILSFVNYIVNPYKVFEHRYDSLFYAKHYQLSDQMSKFYIVNRIKPQTIMMGSSRIAFFPSSQLSPYFKGTIYNLALAGSTIEEQAAYIDYMIRYHQIKNVVWSLDFFSFNPSRSSPVFEPKRLSDSLFLDDYTTALFSFKAFKDSINTVRENPSSPVKTDSLLEQPYTKAEVESNIDKLIHQYASREDFLNSKAFRTPASIDNKIAKVAQIAALCKQKNISLTLYTSPVYYRHIDMIYTIGLGKTFDHWKRAIAHIQPYTDFCTYNSLTRDPMKFRDSSHAIGKVGVLVFARIFDPKNTNYPADFGFTVTEENVDAHLKHERSQYHEFIF